MTSSESPQAGGAETVLPSSLESVDRAEEIVSAVAQEAGFAEEDTFRLGMAVREAMVNAVVHGNRYSANKQVLLTVARTAGAIQVQIEDEGAGLDVGSVPDPLAEENLMKQSGRGLMLIQAFVDGFEVRPRRPAGTVVVLTKRLPPG